MKQTRLIPALIVAALFAGPVHAACYADYKAKQDARQDGPLRLHYGVMEISDAACGDTRAAAQQIGPRLSRAGWVLLNVMGTFGPEGLKGRKASAGEFYLRY